jgi:MFS family permease
VVSGALAATAAVVGLVLLEPLNDHAADDARAGAHDGTHEGASDSAFSWVAWRIKTSALATFSYGYFQASVVLFLPLFLIESKGISEERTILVPAFFAAGMLLFANVAGRIGDRVGHLLVMRSQAAVGLAMIVGFVVLDAYAAMCVAVFVAGATLAAISPVSLALQGLVVPPRDYARANSVYNACYATGMLVGPPISSVLFSRGGGVAMLLHLAALWAVFVVVTWIFRADDPRYRKRAAPAATLELPTGSSPRAQ